MTTRHHWWTPLPQPCPGTRSHQTPDGHTRLNAHLHKLGMTADLTAPGAPHTRTHLNTSSCNVLVTTPTHGTPPITSPLLLRRPTLADLLGGSPDPAWPSKFSNTPGPSYTIGPTAQDLTC
ncbi:hypothetical protein GWK47_043981 [Chionoecetes opilio]|uniref:Uncharacterized protein n=1 Tax=Chionoecetes opilio TaxID=41210 RepID=A0A8J4YEH5_CHIOP|nr:hypothetical protein GWK47_043981 [Chionoecetes opilio]